MKRRSFLHKISHAAAAPMVLPSIFHQVVANNKTTYLSNTQTEGKILVLIKLDGGNDGLNTLIPMDQMNNLSQVRPHVILPENKILQLETHDLGFHPEMNGFKSLFDEKRLKIIQNVGSVTPDFSHFRSMDIWQSASDYDEYINSGWMGRFMENQHPEWPLSYPNENYPDPLSIELGGTASLLFTGNQSFTSYVATDPGGFHEDILFDPMADYPDDYLGMKLRYIDLIKNQSNEYSEVIKRAYERGQTTHEFGNDTYLAQQFDIMAKLITGGLNTRVYMVSIGGFDTHDTQVDPSDHTQGQHSLLLRDLNQQVSKFMLNLDAANRSDDVLCMTFSEFGRTIVSNGSRGTDHGTAAPIFIIGNNIDPEILGNNPVIPNNARWEDNLATEFDFRSVYASVIDQWMTPENPNSEDILGETFPQFDLLRPQNPFDTTKWVLYPNPATDYLQISVPDGITNIQYAIFDLTGRKHVEGQAQTDKSRHCVVTIDALPKGVYLIHINTHTTLKFIKQL